MRTTTSLLCIAVALALAGGAGSERNGRPLLAAYRGLATWVDLYDTASWADPEGSVAEMSARGVRTLFLETGNYRQRVRIVHPPRVARFVEAAHAQGISVVAWYLPSLAHPRTDLLRSLAPIRFRTPLGERFDSFALDIEASIVRSVALRNERLLSLSRRIRSAAGRSYPLGAIIPSPRGMALLPHYWPGFPYARLGRVYDVFLPMGYFSYRPHDLGGAFGYTARNVALIRAGTGRPRIPIHAIGGLADASSAAQVQAFVHAARACGIVGASLYDFPTTRPRAWARLARVPVGQGASRSTCS